MNKSKDEGTTPSPGSQAENPEKLKDCGGEMGTREKPGLGERRGQRAASSSFQSSPKGP